MTKDVLLTIRGAHEAEDVNLQPEDAEGADAIEVICRASYYKKGEKHFVFYDEPVEGSAAIIKNKIQYEAGKLDIIKSGATNSHMCFEDGRINVSDYETPYGQLIVGTHTKLLTMTEAEDEIVICVDYELDLNGSKVADSEISIIIKAMNTATSEN